MDLEKVRMDEERVSMYLKKVRTDDDRVKITASLFEDDLLLDRN